MVCERCGGPLRPLFYSLACDYCDGLTPQDASMRGWVVWCPRPLPAEEYVFATREDAERWRLIQGLVDCDVREVVAPIPLRFRTTTGSVKGLRLADRLVTIFPDHRFPPAPNCAYLA